MTSNVNEVQLIPGVYYLTPDDRLEFVHGYQGGDYRLENIAEHFGIGQWQAGSPHLRPVLTLDAESLQELKLMAENPGFDAPAGFTEMCMEMYRYTAKLPGDLHRFTSNF